LFDCLGEVVICGPDASAHILGIDEERHHGSDAITLADTRGTVQARLPTG
jgi:hypothetical protein